MVKDHSDSEKGNPLPPHRLLFPINSKGFRTIVISYTIYYSCHGIPLLICIVDEQTLMCKHCKVNNGLH